MVVSDIGNPMMPGSEGATQIRGGGGVFGLGLPMMPGEGYHGSQALFGDLGAFDSSTVERIAEVVTFGGAATWLLMASPKAKDYSVKAMGGGIALIAAFKLARTFGLVG
jgi:hypothetical protein